MANSLEPSWNGNDYQARFFWYHAAALRDDEQQHVIEVTFEADGPKGFDDVVVRYRAPGRSTSSRPGRVSVDFHQVKFHAVQGGRFGYQDLVRPEFIGATAKSILEGLRDAKKSCPADAAFYLVTTDRIADGDPLNDAHSTKDHSIRLDRLFSKGGDRSKFGTIRKLWRDHLKLETDAELRDVVSGFHIKQISHSLEDMREEVNNRFRIVGMVTCRESVDFRFDQIARELKKKQQNCLDRDQFEALCREEGWLRNEPSENRTNVSIRTFVDVLPGHLDAKPENTLALLDVFEGKHLLPGLLWADAVQPQTVAFLSGVRQRSQQIRLHLDAHLSIAFLAGSVFGLKSGMNVELVQKSRTGLSVWRPDDGMDGPSIPISTRQFGPGGDTALVVSLSRDGLNHVTEYAQQHLPNVGQVLHAKFDQGAGQLVVAGGAHAARLADDVAEAVRRHHASRASLTHVFIVGPNSFAFYLGQHASAMGACVLYEFDLNRTGNCSYRPTFRIG